MLVFLNIPWFMKFSVCALLLGQPLCFLCILFRKKIHILYRLKFLIFFREVGCRIVLCNSSCAPFRQQDTLIESNLGGKAFISACRSQSVTEGSQGRAHAGGWSGNCDCHLGELLSLYGSAAHLLLLIQSPAAETLLTSRGFYTLILLFEGISDINTSLHTHDTQDAKGQLSAWLCAWHVQGPSFNPWH